MADRTCSKCGKVFDFPSRLNKHLMRKTPCAPLSKCASPSPMPMAAGAEAKPQEFKCQDCGNAFTQMRSLYRHQRNNCLASKRAVARHVSAGGCFPQVAAARLESQDAMANLRQEIKEEVMMELIVQMAKNFPPGCAPVSTPSAAPSVVAQQNNGIVQTQIGSQHNTVTVTMNFFGSEDTSHITKDDVRRLLDETLSEPGEAVDQAIRALVRTAMLVYSDPDHPENLTCYIPNKKESSAMVHGEKGWLLQPCQIVYPRMACTAVDILFANQPFDGADRYCDVMRALRANEQAYSAGKELHPIIVRNKDLLERALGTLPRTSDATGDVR